MARFLRDRAGNLYGFNEAMAKQKDLYTAVDEGGNPIQDEDDWAASRQIGPTVVTDYVPGQKPPEPPSFEPNQPAPGVTDYQPTPDGTEEDAKLAQSAAGKSRGGSAKKASVSDKRKSYQDQDGFSG